MKTAKAILGERLPEIDGYSFKTKGKILAAMDEHALEQTKPLLLVIKNLVEAGDLMNEMMDGQMVELGQFSKQAKVHKLIKEATEIFTAL